MSAPIFKLPCSHLDHAGRVDRLVMHIWRRGEGHKIEAGTCQVCGHQLPIAFRAIKPSTTPEKPAEVVEIPSGSKEATDIRARIANGSLWDSFERTGWLIFDCCACPSLTESVWAEAQKAVEQKQRERRQVARPDAPEPEPSIRDPRRIGNRGSLSLAELTGSAGK